MADQAAQAITNARLADETERRANELTALHETVRDLATQRDLTTLLQIIVDRAIALLAASGGGVYLYDVARDDLELAVIKGPYIKVGTRLKIGEGLAGRVAQTRQPLIVEDYSTWEHRSPQYEGVPLTAVVDVPMLYGGELIGVLVVHEIDPTTRRFTDDDVHLLSLFAGHAAAAVQNARLFQETRQRAERLALLNRIARAISTTLNLDELLKIVYQEITAVMPVEALFIALYDRAANELDYRIRVDKGIREPAMRRPLATSLTSSVITSKQPILIRDFEREKEHLSRTPGRCTPVVHLPGVRESLPQSWLGVPMLLGENVVGVISVQAYRPNAYGQAEQELLSTIADAVTVAIDNARLYEETQKHAAELDGKAHDLEVIHRVSSLAGSSLDLDRILNAVTEQMVRLFGVDHSGILLFDQAHTCGRVAAEYPATGALGVQFPVQGYPAAEQIIAHPQPLAIEDTQSDPLLAPVREAMRRLDIRSMLILPLVVKGEVVGSIGLDAVGKPRRFRSEEIALAQTIANQVAVAIDNARLFQAERKKHELAETLRAVAQVVTSSLDPTEVFELILDQVGRVLPYDSASILMVQGKKLVFHVGRGFPQPELVKNLSLDIEAVPTRQVILERKPMVLADTAERPDWARMPGSEYIRSWIGAPMVVKDNVLGMLCLDKAEPNFYTPEDAQVAFAFAGQAAVAVQNAQLFAQRERRVRELSALNQISQAVSAILDRDELMEELYRQISLLLGTETFYIAFYHPETEELEFAFGVEEGKRREPARHNMQAGLTEYIVRHRQPLLIPNNVEGFCQEHGIVPVGRPAKSWLGVPLLVGTAETLRVSPELLGVMAVQDFRNPQAFDQEDLELLSTIANQVAVSFQNARLFQESQRTAREMSLLFQGSQALTAIDPDELLPRTVAALKETFGYALCLVLLLDRDSNELSVKASAGEWPTLDRGMRFRVGIDGLIGHGAAQEQVLYVPDVRTDSRYICGNPEVRSEVVVPLRGREGLLGVLDVESTQVDGFSQRDIMVLSTWASGVAVAIDNARLYQRTLDQLAQLQAAQQELLQSARMAAAGELASGLAHEINNPLTVILGNAELLQLSRGLNPSAQAMVASISRGADRIANIVRVFLSLTAPTARPPEPIALDPLIHSVVDRIISPGHLEGVPSGVRVGLELDLPPDLPKVRANPEQLQQVFLSLMANAIEAMPKGGKLTVAARVEQGFVVIRFSDTGKGIAPENIGQAFEPGFTTKIQEGRVRGVGLGLYSARQIIKAHGGDITIESKLGVGTTVTVTLPAAEDRRF